MIFARTSKAASRLSEQIRTKQLKKEYLAIIDGKFEKEKDILEDYLLKNKEKNISKIVNQNTKNSKYSKLEYETLKYDKQNDISALKIKLHTGRHHQIRVQLSSRNHSIYGDQKYGTRGKEKQIALWAYKLTIIHPITKKEITFKSIPKLNNTWKILENTKI